MSISITKKLVFGPRLPTEESPPPIHKYDSELDITVLEEKKSKQTTSQLINTDPY